MANRTLRLIAFGASPAIVAARVHGLLDAEGLDIESVETPSSTAQMRGLGKGEWELASTAFDNVLAWSGREGAEFAAIAPASLGVSLPVVVRPEIDDWDDLRGKALAVDAVDTAYALVLRRILLAHGLDFDKGDYTLVPAGATGYRFASMESGETFAAILNPPWNETAARAGMKSFGDHRETLPAYPGGVYAVDKAWAADNRAAVVGFARALAGTLAWVHDPATAELAARRVAAETGGTPEAAAAALARLPRDLTLPVDGLEVVLDLRVRFGLTPPKGPAIETYIDRSFAEEALRS